jgi:hypothetical protein
MKKLVWIVLVFVFMGAAESCVVKKNANGEVPPGQMKKITGEKSAKKYAPGQQKKTN